MYSNGTKETYRGWVWNRIVEFLPGWHIGIAPSRQRELCWNASVVYLTAEGDWDRKVAEAKGFDSRKLTAVNRDKKIIDSVRRQGGIGILGSIEEVLSHWNDTSPTVVYADYCGGFNRSAFALLNAVNYAMDKPGVIAVNMLHGRDDPSNWIRSSMARVGVPDYMVKHRGFELRTQVMADVINAHLDADGLEGEGRQRKKLVYIQHFEESFPAAFYSYMSKDSPNRFDAVVMRWNGRGQIDESAWRAEFRLPSSIRKMKNPAGKLAALKAVRTKRLREAS